MIHSLVVAAALALPFETTCVVTDSDVTFSFALKELIFSVGL